VDANLSSDNAGLWKGPVAKFENGREMGRAGPHFTTTIRGQPSLKAEPIRPFPGLLTNFATGPAAVRRRHRADRGRLVGR
jgi:hypothetical protein